MAWTLASRRGSDLKMDPSDRDVDRRELIEAVFEETLDLPPDRRGGWLAARCGADEDLRREVEALLAALDRPDRLLDGGAAPFAALAATLVPELGGQHTIGPYRILREIGRGGMGVVYLADRNDGQFRHRVAIKLLLAGQAAGELYRRFLAERQFLAMLSHPNIAQLLDGGISDSGVPYLVIEHVDGLPITTYCEQEGLGLEARLRLFRAACAAIHHAHANLVLHLDVKPANILVTRDGQVKLLDFGIAKLLEPRPTDRNHAVTRTAARPMTPAYASPEQALSGRLSTASDVYALGLVLYELLTGTHAFALNGQTTPQVVTAMAEQEPLKPSLRPSPRARELRGDLDAIVMMALRKEPERRYGSADLFSEDIGRYLDGVAVLAHRGSSIYRFRKAVRRHRAATAGALMTALALLGGGGAALWQARVAQREQAAAATAQAEAEEVTAFLVGMFGPGQLVIDRAEPVSVTALLRRGADRAALLNNRPQVQARLLDALSLVHQNLGNLAESDTFASRSVLVWQAARGPSDLRVASAMARLAEVRRYTGAYRSADSLATAALAIRRRAWGPVHADVAESLHQLSVLAVYLDDLPRAIALVSEGVAIRRQLPDGDSLLVRDVHTLASSLWRQGRIGDAINAYRESEAIARRVFRSPSASHAAAQMRLAERLSELPGGRTEATALARAALAETRADLGEANSITAQVLASAAEVLGTAGGREAEIMLRQAVEIERRVAPGLGPLGFTLVSLARHLTASGGSLAEAEHLQREALAILSSQFGPRHSATAGVLLDLGDILLRRGAVDSAERCFRDAVAIRIEAHGRDSYIAALTSLGLARVAAARGDVVRADSVYAAARTILTRSTLPTHPDVVHLDSARNALRRPPFPADVLPLRSRAQSEVR